jgi:hypothetical protein
VCMGEKFRAVDDLGVQPEERWWRRLFSVQARRRHAALRRAREEIVALRAVAEEARRCGPAPDPLRALVERDPEATAKLLEDCGLPRQARVIRHAGQHSAERRASA